MIVVDRFEGERAVLEVDGEMVDIPRSALPPGTREGDRLRWVREDSDLDDARARLRRLKARTPAGSDEIDL